MRAALIASLVALHGVAFASGQRQNAPDNLVEQRRKRGRFFVA